MISETVYATDYAEFSTAVYIYPASGGIEEGTD